MKVAFFFSDSELVGVLVGHHCDSLAIYHDDKLTEPRVYEVDGLPENTLAWQIRAATQVLGGVISVQGASLSRISPAKE